MNTDVGDLLRQGMERFTGDLRAPAGLTRRVAQRRRRRLALRSAAGVAAALTAGAVALVAVEVPGALHNGADASAYVVKRVSSALSAAEPGEIAQIAVTTRGVVMPGSTTVTTTAEEWSYGARWRSVMNSPAGQPVYDEGSGTVSVYTLVSYLTRTWAREHESGRTPVVGRRDCEPAVAALTLLFQPELPGMGRSAGSPSATVPGALRAAISCGTLSVAGRHRVDGIDAIELKSRPDSPASETIWVSPGTYLPLRVVVRSYGPHHGLFVNDQRVLLVTADITWLPPTAQNLAKLTVPIPAGFRHLPLADVVTPIMRQTPGLSTKPKVCLGRGGPACSPPVPLPARSPPPG